MDAHTTGTQEEADRIGAPATAPDAGANATGAASPAGGPEEPRIDGPAGGPVVVVHADLSCPDCAVALDRLTRLPVRLDLRHMILRSRGVRARRAALALEAADVQGAYWPFVHHLRINLGRQEIPDLWELAGDLGLDVEQFEADRRAEVGADRIARETREALRTGAVGVPAVFADGEVENFLRTNGYDGDVRIRSKK